jgi:hypothetical protein
MLGKRLVMIVGKNTVVRNAIIEIVKNPIFISIQLVGCLHVNVFWIKHPIELKH